LLYLHQLDIIYRDIKLENVLMDDKGHVYITDFGLSKEGVTGSNVGAQTFCGTAEYIAPELLEQVPYGKCADWWSFGILVFEMITGRTPFFNRNKAQMFDTIKNKNVRFPNGFPADAQSMITGLLTKDPNQRLGYGDLDSDFVDHDYFAPYKWEDLKAKKVLPPYKPSVKGPKDTKYVNQVYLDAPVVDSTPGSDMQVGEEGYNESEHFDGFEFSMDGEVAPATSQSPRSTTTVY
jgi:serine/threonine protein kinase